VFVTGMPGLRGGHGLGLLKMGQVTESLEFSD
jgi:hypothetical protein